MRATRSFEPGDILLREVPSLCWPHDKAEELVSSFLCAPAEIQTAVLDMAAPDRDSGLEWIDMGSEVPMDGSPLEHPALAQALAKQTQFTRKEWEAFGISKLRMDHFIVSGNSCFRPANPRRSCPSLWAAFLVNGA